MTRLLVVGNVAEDLAGDQWVPGGPSLYVSRLAVSMGAEVALLTHINPAYDTEALHGINMIAAGDRPLPRFHNRYDETGHREQVLYEHGHPILPQDITRTIQNAAPDAMFIAPAVRELLTVPRVSVPRFFSLQGYFRTTDAANHIIPDPETWQLLEPLLQPDDTTFCSVEDAGDPDTARDITRRLAEHGVRACITNGDRGAWIPAARPDTCPYDLVPAIPAEGVVDPTGAGDAFATAFCIRFLETGDVRDAARYGLAAGSLAVERSGILDMPDRAAIETRAKQAGER